MDGGQGHKHQLIPPTVQNMGLQSKTPMKARLLAYKEYPNIDDF